MGERWRLKCVGVPLLQGDSGRGKVVVLARKDAALLAYVGMNPGTTSALVAELLWPAAGARGALNNLRQRLHRLRKATAARLLEVSDTARLADDLLLEPAPQLAALQADPCAWDGQWLQGIELDDAAEFSAWLAAERKAWVERRRDALATIASDCEKSGELVRALGHAQRLVADDPLSEHVHRRVMRVHYLRGDTAAAVAAFETCERTLKDELGLRPGAETRALLETIERGTLSPAAGTAPLPASLLRPPRAVGRSAERARLAQVHGAGDIAALIGEAGMGKTRLLQDFLSTRPQAVYAQARPGDAATPYGALARLLRAVVARHPAALAQAPRNELARLAPEIGDGAGGPASGQAGRLQAAVEQLLTAALASNLHTAVVDDLHFADRASIEMLRALVDAEQLAALRWVFAHRPAAAAEEDSALLRSLADAPRVHWIVLAPLSDADLVELLDSLALPGVDAATLAPALARHTGGNPLYVLETLRAAHPAVGASTAAVVTLPRPQSIAHMIDRRLQRLSEEALLLGRVAALAGAAFTPELAEHVLATPALRLAGAWAELEAADVLRGNTFAHDLVRDGMLRATPQAIAVHAHRTIAQYLSARAGEPAALAQHWRAAGEHGRAAAAFRQAAGRAREAGRPREEALLLHEAASSHQAAGDDAAALVAEIDALPATLRSAGVAQALEQSALLVAQAAGGPSAGAAATMRAMALAWAGRADEAEASGRQALELLGEGAATMALRLEATRTVAMMCGLRGRPGDGLALLQPWMQRLHELPDSADRIWFCGAMTNLLLQADRPGEALVLAQRHLALAAEAGDDLEQLTSLINAGSAHVRRGELAQAVAHADRAALLAPPERQASTLAGINQAVLGYALCGLGRYAEGLAALQQALTIAAAISPGSVLHAMAEEMLAQVYERLGQRARAQQLVAADHASLTGHRQANRLLVRSLVRPAGAARDALVQRALELATDGPGVHVRMNAMLVPAQGEPDAAVAERCGFVLDLAAAKEYLPLVAQAAALRLDAWCRAGRLDLVAASLHDAERCVRATGTPQAYWPALMLACARAHAALGDVAAAGRCVGDAQAWVNAALAHVPDEFQESFRYRNPTNPELRALAARSLAGARGAGDGAVG